MDELGPSVDHRCGGDARMRWARAGAVVAPCWVWQQTTSSPSACASSVGSAAATFTDVDLGAPAGGDATRILLPVETPSHGARVVAPLGSTAQVGGGDLGGSGGSAGGEESVNP